MNPAYYDVIMNGGRAIPGSSLTRDPDNPAPYEKPPEYVNIHQASEWIFGELIKEENYEQLMQVLLEDMPVMDVVQLFLFKGFTEGKWTVDLMMLLAEPMAYMVLALAERAGIDPVIFRGEENDEAEEEVFFGTKIPEERMRNIREFEAMDTPLPYISEEQRNKLEELKTIPVEQQPEETQEPPTSLLAEPEEEV